MNIKKKVNGRKKSEDRVYGKQRKNEEYRRLNRSGKNKVVPRGSHPPYLDFSSTNTSWASTKHPYPPRHGAEARTRAFPCEAHIPAMRGHLCLHRAG